MADHESESGTAGASEGTSEGTSAQSASAGGENQGVASSTGSSTEHRTGSDGSESPSGASSASAAFAAGRAERKENVSDGGVGQSDGGGPSEAPTVEHAHASRTEVMGASAESQGTPTVVQSRPEFPPQQAQRAPGRSGPSVIGGAVRRVLNLLATLVALVGLLCALVLVAFVVLRVVAINPENVVAQAVGSIADRLVGPFRDLFLVPDPVGLAVNYGLAALCWLIAALIVARILRAVGRVLP